MEELKPCPYVIQARRGYGIYLYFQFEELMGFYDDPTYYTPEDADRLFHLASSIWVEEYDGQRVDVSIERI